jgi:glutathione synthase/RimK-type ligase-like ATP-grasp enzyme
MKKRFFETVLEEICGEESLDLKFFSDGWLGQISKDGKMLTHTVGYNFDLNPASAHLLCADKVLTSIVLDQTCLPIVKYFMINNQQKKNYLSMQNTHTKDVDKILGKMDLPVVVKPTQGTTGRDVFLCNSRDEVLEKILKIGNTDDVCISKYIESEFEYRFYVLNNKILFAYKKIKNGDWRPNLSCGAVPELLKNSEIEKYSGLVLNTVKALNLTCGAIDILLPKSGPVVLEVNTGIAMDYFARASKEYYKIAKDAHKKMLQKCLL